MCARSTPPEVCSAGRIDQNFHDVTIVDMGDLPESHVSMPELSELIHKWPPAVIIHNMWRQQELEQMCKAAKGKYRQKHPAPCTFCGALIKNDMYRHVARRHLELTQLWRCPVSWCTVWRGAPQDLMDHIREAHNVTGEIRKVSLEMLLPPWTVTRMVYMESLTSRRSGISNDVLLFSKVGLSLVHHYRVHKRGLPHAAFRGKYLAQLRALLPLPTILPTVGGSTDAAASTLSCTTYPPDVLCAAPRPSRRAIGRWRPRRVMEPPLQIAPRLTEQDPLAAAGAVVFDCRPPLMPVSMDITDIVMSTIRSSVLSADSDGVFSRT